MLQCDAEKMSREMFTRCCCRSLLAAGSLPLLLNYSALGNPTGGTVTQGSATFNSSGSTFNINQTSANAFITWNGFNIGSGETVNFNQPTAQSVTFNQINDVNPSQILGNLNANGYVILENANGFYVGGQAVLNAHGLIMTTATPTVNFADGGPWSFDAPPPTAKIQNYGQINITGGGTAYLIAADIVNHGTITAPNGHIGLYDGETVLVSMSPNGEGLSAQVTLPEGSVDNEGKLTADGGSVVAQAQFVNQNGLLQANTAQNVNGTIELLGSSSVALGASSVISAAGDSTAAKPSAGGSVQIQAGISFSDDSGSAINVSGASQGGNAGQISLSAPQMSALNSALNGQAAAGYLNGTLTVNTADIALNSDGSPVANSLALDVSALSSGFSQINLQASDDITLDTPWTLAVNGGIPSSVLLQGGNKISLNRGSGIEADGGNITLKAPTVDQAGTLQANSVGSANGVIAIDASQDLILEASSAISANGDPSATSPSPGGFVVLNAGNNYSDASGSTISALGVDGGQGGVVEIFDPQATAASPGIQSTIVSGSFAYLVNPFDLTLSTDPTATSSTPGSNPTFNVSDLAAYSQIDLQALDNITLSAKWTLNSSTTTPADLILSAGNSIIIPATQNQLPNGILAGHNWSVNLAAGTALAPSTPPPALAPNNPNNPNNYNYGIYLGGDPSIQNSSFIQSQNGNITLWAANEVHVGWTGASAGSGVVDPGLSSITTVGGGSVQVTTEYGDVNTGSNPDGYVYSLVKAAATGSYYSIGLTPGSLGGISTAAGGNVTINAGINGDGNAISYVPAAGSSTFAEDGGTGAFGSQPGNVTITAGGSVYGHYVLGDGVGTVTAGQDIGTVAGKGFALSLVSGGWNVNAPNGTIYLQEVRNPNGDFNVLQPTKFIKTNPGANLFDYGPQDYVNLTAYGVVLTSQNVPRLSAEPVPVVYPSILDITAGSGGVKLEGNVALFPSANQNLDIITTAGGNLFSSGAGAPYYLLMSDGASSQWLGSTSFTTSDHGTLQNEPTEFQPVIINLSGIQIINNIPMAASMEDINLITTKVTDITVQGNIMNAGFSGQNLQAGDVTSINVGGRIFNTSSYFFVALGQAIPNIPAEDLLQNMGQSWDDVFTLAVDPAALTGLITEIQAQLKVPTVTLSELLNFLIPSTPGTPAPSISELADALLTAQIQLQNQSQNVSVFGEQTINSLLVGNNPGFVYDSTSRVLGFAGFMPASVSTALAQSLTILHLVNGEPVIDENPNDNSPGRTYNQIETDTISWAPTASVGTLAQNSVGRPALTDLQLGDRIGGPGAFDITAGSISLGNSYGILSLGVSDAQAPLALNRYGNLASITPAGATINVTVTGSDQPTDPSQPAGPDNLIVSSLNMLTSAIASLGGGDVNVFDTGGSMDLGSASLFQVIAGGTTTAHLAYGIFTSGGGNVNVTALDDVDIDGSRIATYDGGDVFIESFTGNVNVGNGSSDLNTVFDAFTSLRGSVAQYGEDVFGSGIEAETLEPPAVGVPFPPAPAAVPGNITVETPQGSIVGGVAGIIQVALDGSLTPGPTVTLDAGTFASGTPGQPGYVAPFTGNIDFGNSPIIGGNVNLSANGFINVGDVISRQNSTVNAAQSFSGNILAGGTANVSAGGTVSGTIAGIGGVNVNSTGDSTASLLGQNVNANGKASDTLGSTANATSSTQSAAQQASSQSQKQAASDQTQESDNKKKKPQIQKVSHVTVLLSAAVPK
jgi:filamentous hemagglutinin family protein